jgi:tripartite-type tricarboxylate transporter receptor subunit TctC
VKHKSILLALLSASVFTAWSVEADTQASYPDRPISLVVPYATGGFATTLGHIVAEGLEAQLKQPVVVDNKPGANGNLASRYVANAKPDGYTLILTTSAILCINPALYPDTPFDSLKDFAPVSQVITTALVGVVKPDSGYNTMLDVVTYAKNNPGKLTFGSSGVGSLMHLSGELLKIQADVDALHVPYNGGGPAVVDLMGGRIDMMFSDTNVLPHVSAGKLKALAVTGTQRIPALPDTPTVAEAGVEGFAAEAWYSVMAPANTPPDVVRTVSAALNKVLSNPEVRTRLLGYGVSPATDTTPEHVQNLLTQDLDKWKSVVRDGNIRIDK